MKDKEEIIGTIIGATLVICFVFLIGFVAISLVSKTVEEVEKTRVGQKIAYWLSEPKTKKVSITDEATPAVEKESLYIEMEVTAYCICEKCCGEWSDGYTASGKRAVDLICAAPPEYPFGTEFTVDGVVYVCEDRGGAIVGNKLDLLFRTHQEALKWGRRTLMVKVERPVE